jgi:hypothetical protein
VERRLSLSFVEERKVISVEIEVRSKVSLLRAIRLLCNTRLGNRVLSQFCSTV